MRRCGSHRTATAADSAEVRSGRRRRHPDGSVNSLPREQRTWRSVRRRSEEPEAARDRSRRICSPAGLRGGARAGRGPRRELRRRRPGGLPCSGAERRLAHTPWRREGSSSGRARRGEREDAQARMERSGGGRRHGGERRGGASGEPAASQVEERRTGGGIWERMAGGSRGRGRDGVNARDG
jgi:hypothetical protein